MSKTVSPIIESEVTEISKAIGASEDDVRKALENLLKYRVMKVAEGGAQYTIETDSDKIDIAGLKERKKNERHH